MDLQYDFLSDTQQICAEFAARLTLERSRTCQAHIVRILRRLIERKCVAEAQKLSSASTSCMQSRSSHLANASRPRVWVPPWQRVRYGLPLLCVPSTSRSICGFLGRAFMSRHNAIPARSPIAAMPPPSRAAPHDSGLLWCVIPSTNGTSIHYTLPA